MSQNFVTALLTEKKVVETLPEGYVQLSYKHGSCGSVIYKYAPKSQETLEKEMLEAEQKEIEETLNYAMAKAILKMEIRREQYRIQDIIDYGYDKYLEEYEYEPEEDEDEEGDEVL